MRTGALRPRQRLGLVIDSVKERNRTMSLHILRHLTHCNELSPKSFKLIEILRWLLKGKLGNRIWLKFWIPFSNLSKMKIVMKLMFLICLELRDFSNYLRILGLRPVYLRILTIRKFIQSNR